MASLSPSWHAEEPIEGIREGIRERADLAWVRERADLAWVLLRQRMLETGMLYGAMWEYNSLWEYAIHYDTAECERPLSGHPRRDRTQRAQARRARTQRARAPRVQPARAPPARARTQPPGRKFRARLSMHA